MINGTNESDSEVLWTWERMLERTKPYCECYDYYCEMLKMHIIFAFCNYNQLGKWYEAFDQELETHSSR